MGVVLSPTGERLHLAGFLGGTFWTVATPRGDDLKRSFPPNILKWMPGASVKPPIKQWKLELKFSKQAFSLNNAMCDFKSCEG